MSQTADAIGQRLKAERERRALSVEKAADDLHFDVSVVEALEAGDFARLGPAVYGKGHLKRYAEFLGLPAAEMLESFATRPEPADAGSTGATLHMPADPSGGGDPKWIPAAGAAAAVLMVAAMLWWQPWRVRTVSPAAGVPGAPAPAPALTDPSIPPADADADQAEADRADVGRADARRGDGDRPDPRREGMPAPNVRPTTGPPAAASAATAVSAAAAVAEPATGIGRATLRLRFSADSWVDVHDAAGVRVFAGKGLANSVKTIAGAAPMRVYIGFASGVQLEVNNHAVAIGPQFVAGDVARFEAGADGVLRREARTHDVAARNAPPRT